MVPGIFFHPYYSVLPDDNETQSILVRFYWLFKTEALVTVPFNTVIANQQRRWEHRNLLEISNSHGSPKLVAARISTEHHRNVPVILQK